MMPTNLIKNLMKVLAYNIPFYAADLNLNGGEVNGLAVNGYIVPTGNTRKVMIQIDTWTDERIFKEVTVKEWKLADNPSEYHLEAWKREFAETIIAAKEILTAAAALGWGEI